MKEIIKAENKSDVVSYLESYRSNKKLIQMMRYEKEYFKDDFEESVKDGDYLSLPVGDEVLLRSAMFKVRKFIMSIGENNCRLILYYHYIKGQPIAKCAELLGVSRTSAFRLRKKALSIAERKYSEERLLQEFKKKRNLAV